MITDFNLFRCRLEAERKHLIEELEQVEVSVYPAGGNPLDEVEMALERFELEKKLTSEERMRDDLAGVEHALAKFEKGTYGLCDNCGQPIGTARLEVLPHANLCLSCKAQEEKKAKSRPIPQRERVARYPSYDEKVTHILNFNAPDELAGVEEDEEVS